METYPRFDLTGSISEIREIQNVDPRRHKDLQKGKWVASIDFKDYFHIPINPQSRKCLRFHVQGQSYQFKALPFRFINCSNGIHSGSQGSHSDCSKQGYKNTPVPGRLVGQSHIPPNLTPSCSLVAMYRGWIVHMKKLQLMPKQIFDFVGYQFDIKEGKIRPTLERWETFNLKIPDLLEKVIPIPRSFHPQ